MSQEKTPKKKVEEKKKKNDREGEKPFFGAKTFFGISFFYKEKKKTLKTFTQATDMLTKKFKYQKKKSGGRGKGTVE